MTQLVLTVGPPGCGKTTWSRSLPQPEWVTVSLDGLRCALWGSKKTYHELVGHVWKMRGAPERNADLTQLLHAVERQAVATSLAIGHSVAVPNMHITTGSMHAMIQSLQRRHLRDPYPMPQISLRIYLTSVKVLLERNKGRPPDDWCDPDYIKKCHHAMHAKDAWWRESPWHKEYVDG